MILMLFAQRTTLRMARSLRIVVLRLGRLRVPHQFSQLLFGPSLLKVAVAPVHLSDLCYKFSLPPHSQTPDSACEGKGRPLFVMEDIISVGAEVDMIV